MVNVSFKKKYLSSKDEPYFIAEIGINHNGNLNLVKKMISASKASGANAVKFQKRDVNDLLNYNLKPSQPIGYLSKNEKDIPKNSVKFGNWAYPDTRLELSKENYFKIKNYCKRIKIDLIVSPWDESSVDFICDLKIKAIKIASIDANNYHFCEYIAKKKCRTIISTGMCTYNELLLTKKIFLKYKTPHMFLHCTSSYPSNETDKNLNCIPVLKKLLKCDIGFSGHGEGFIGTASAVALGANVIEKHVTLNKKMSGPDHAASLEFEEFEDCINIAKKAYVSLGSNKKIFLKSEKILHDVLIRKFVLIKNQKKNSRLNRKNLKTALVYSKSGILPNNLYKILGKRLKRNLNKGHIIKFSDLKK